MPHEVVMPALGMAQESGVIVAWHKAVGDPVAVGDLLMEVETDKAVMEVEAQAVGFLTELRAGEGADVPVGEVIAIIGTTVNDEMVSRVPAPAPVPDTETVASAPAAEVPAAPILAAAKVPAISPTFGQRILASPKAKRLAKGRALDLNRLVESGHPQPFHVADLEVLAAMPATGDTAARISARARVPAAAFDAFLAWFEPETGQPSTTVIAAFAAGAYRAVTDAEKLVVLVTAPRSPSVTYLDPDRAGLKSIAPLDSTPAPDVIVCDLTSTRLMDIDLGANRRPTLSVGRDGEHMLASLAAAPATLDDDQLVGCLDAFAGRLDEPLRHLL